MNIIFHNAVIIAIVVGIPLATISSLNHLFGLSIALDFYSWLSASMIWLFIASASRNKPVQTTPIISVPVTPEVLEEMKSLHKKKMEESTDESQ